MMRSSTNRCMIGALKSSSTPIVPPSPSSSILLPLSFLPSSSSLSYPSLLPLSSRLSLHNNSFSSSSLYSSTPSFRSFSSSADPKKQETTDNNNTTNNTDTNTNQSSSSSSSSTTSSTPSSSSSSPSPSPFNLFSFLRSEADHIKEFATKKFGLLPPKTKRSLEEFKIKYEKEVKERDKLLKQRYPAGGPGTGKIPLSGTQSKKINNNPNKEEEIKNDRKELILAEEKLTVWERRWRNFRSSFEETTIIKSVKGVQRKVATSDHAIINNPLIKDVKQTIEEAKDIWESQDPIINNIRNIGDKIFGETETGFAIGEAKKRDPSFNLLDFMEEMEHYYAPIVVEAWRKGDIYLMNKITEGRAKAYILGNFRGRAEKFEKWDDRILDLKGFDFTGASVQQDTPVFTFYFLAQHVDHMIDIRNQNTVKGSEYNINTHYYVFMVTQDKTNPDFDYKIIDFVAQEIKELGASSSSSSTPQESEAAKKAGASTKTSSSEKSSDKSSSSDKQQQQQKK